MKLYIVTMERYGNREGHHYNIGLFSDLADATIEGLSHQLFRDNKYEVRIELAEVDSERNIENIPLDVAINYAILKYPNKFNDKKQLIEE